MLKDKYKLRIIKVRRKVAMKPKFARVTQESSEKLKVLKGHRYDPSKHNITGWWVSEKLDGMRAYWNGDRLVTGGGKPINAPDWFIEPLRKSTNHLDGELFAGRGNFQDVVSACRKNRPRDNEWRQITYQVFDAPNHTAPFASRYEKIIDIISGMITDHVQVVIHEPIVGDLDKMLSMYEEKGAEGLMIRNPTSYYEYGRSSTILKHKSFLDADATVVGIQAGGGKHEGRMGAIICELDNGKRFKIGTGFSDRQRENPPEVGDRIIFKYFELTRSGTPRFPAYVGVRGD